MTPRTSLVPSWLIYWKHVTVCHTRLLLLDSTGFNLPALNPIKNYWANGKQTAKVNYSYSCLSDILFGVPCELNLHLLLFKIFLNDLILIIWDINTFSYVDKNARHDSCDTIEEVLSVKIIQKNFFSDLQVIRLRVALVSVIL